MLPGTSEERRGGGGLARFEEIRDVRQDRGEGLYAGREVMGVTHPYQNVVIAGAYNTVQARRLPGHTDMSIALEAAKGVLACTGISIDAIDGIFGRGAETAYHLGLNSVSAGDSVGIAGVLDAARAIASGACETVLVLSGGAGAYVDRDATAPWTRPMNEWVAPFGLYTAAEFALMARRHMHMYGTTAEQLAIVASTIRNNGHVNPEAVYFDKGPYTPQNILDSRMVADPYHLLDCSTTSEGGCAMLLTTPERAADAKLPTVRILGGATDRFGPSYQFPPIWDLSGSRIKSGTAGFVGRRAARIAFRTAGLHPSDVDICEFYDPFSFEIIRQFEAFEFCAEGEGGDFVMDGRIGPGGQFPVTTDGGTTSYSHAGRPQMMQRVARGVHQIQGECVSNQVVGAEVVMCSTSGSGALCNDVILLGKELK